MVDTMKDLESTILEVRQKISDDPDPFLIEVLSKLVTIRDNQQEYLMRKAQDTITRGFKSIESLKSN